MAVGANINQFLRSHKNDNFESFCMLWFIDVVICSDLRRSSFLKDFHFAIKRYQRELANNANLILASSSFTNTDRFQKYKNNKCFFDLAFLKMPRLLKIVIWFEILATENCQGRIFSDKFHYISGVSKLKVHCLSFRCFRNNKEH